MPKTGVWLWVASPPRVAQLHLLPLLFRSDDLPLLPRCLRSESSPGRCRRSETKAKDQQPKTGQGAEELVETAYMDSLTYPTRTRVKCEQSLSKLQSLTQPIERSPGRLLHPSSMEEVRAGARVEQMLNLLPGNEHAIHQRRDP